MSEFFIFFFARDEMVQHSERRGTHSIPRFFCFPYAPLLPMKYKFHKSELSLLHSLFLILTDG